MQDDLYDQDIVLWCNRQAGLLRRMAAGERVNQVVDWPNLIEEVEALGRSETRACINLLRQALIHLTKQAAWPDHRAASHWRGETIGLLFNARKAFSPSMRQQIDFGELYHSAREEALALAAEMGGPRPTRELPPFSVDEMLAQQPDIDALAAKLAL